MLRLAKLDWILVLACSLAMLALYGLAGGSDFIFDSAVALTRNAAIAIDGTALEEWRIAALSSSSGPLGRPLAMLTFAANHAVAGGLDPVHVRLTNALIHLVVALLVYRFLYLALSGSTRLTLSRQESHRIALLAAAIWLLHPLHVSTVLYAVQRMAQLSTLFVLFGLVYFLRWRLRWLEVAPSAGQLLACALGLGLISLAGLWSKENAVLLWWLLPVVEVTLFRAEWGGRSLRWLSALGWLALLAPVAVVLLLLLLHPNYLLGGYAQRDFDLPQRLLTQARVLWHYVAWIGLPDITAMGLHHDDITLSRGLMQPVTTLLALVAWVTLLLTAFLLRRRQPLLLFAVLFYLVAHSLESSVLALELAYEHRNYLPSVAVVLVMAWLLVTVLRGSERPLQLIAPVALLLLLTVLLALRTQVWSDELQLARHHLRHHPDSPRSNYHFANTSLRRAQQEPAEPAAQNLLVQARHYYERLYQLDQGSVAALTTLFYLDSIYFPALQEQVDWFPKILPVVQRQALQPEDYNALSLLTDCLVEKLCRRDATEVAALYDALKKKSPGNPQILFQWSRYQNMVRGDAVAAGTTLRSLLQSRPDYAPAYYALMQMESERQHTAAVIELSRQLLAHDREHRELGRIADIYEPGGDPVD